MLKKAFQTFFVNKSIRQVYTPFNKRFYSFKEPILKLIPDSNLRIAIVGRPNVGKSTLYNKFVGGYHAIVDHVPGVTIDCQEDKADLFGIKFTAIDTPGADNIDTILEQTKEALKTADLCIVVTDFKEGITEWDERIGKYLVEKQVPAIHVINKCDTLVHSDDPDTFKGHELPLLGKPIPIAADSGLGLERLHAAILPFSIRHSILKDWSKKESSSFDDVRNIKIIDSLPSDFENDNIIRMAIIGKANVGKSTMINKLIGRERVVVSSIPGTTRDTIQMKCTFKGRNILLADTAGMRKDKHITTHVQQMSLEDTLRTIKFANVCILLVDAQSPLTNDDLKIANMVERHGRALIICANKWDLVTDPYKIAHDIECKLLTSLSQLHGLNVIVTSAKTGKNLNLLMNKTIETFDKWDTRITTGKLNRFLQNFLATQSIPQGAPKIKYITQATTRPPTFILFYSGAKEFPKSFQRQISLAIRNEFNLDGVPFRIYPKKTHANQTNRKLELVSKPE